jgi:ABC-type lipoprotein release transport system permease subunit
MLPPPAEVVPPHLTGSSRHRHNDGMALAWYAARATWRRSWRATLLIAVIGGLLGAVALGALAGARRTDSAYGRYLRSVNASDVMVDIPGPYLPLIRDVEAEPGVLSSAAWIGLDAAPVISGNVDTAFQTDAIAGSLDGEFYRQDKLTVLAGKLPPASSTGEVILTPQMADHFHLTVGDRMTWQFYRPQDNGTDRPATRTTFTVAAIADVSPALVDDFDTVETAILPASATARYLKGGEWSFGWASLRLREGDAGVYVLSQHLDKLGAEARADHNNFPFTFTIRRLAIVKHEAQQAIEPQAVALAVLGGLAVIALLTLMTQGLAQLLTRSAPAPTLRAMGASRAAAAAATAAWGAVAVAGAVVISVGGAIAVSPLAPIGPVRRFDPVKGLQADWLVLGGGAAILLILLAAALAWLAWRAVRRESELPSARSSALVSTASRVGLPVTVVAGIRHALEPGSGRVRAPVRATLTGSVVAVTALVAALVFGASLTGLITHPAEYGWNWDLVIQSQGGWGSWPPGALDKPLAAQPGVTAWAELGFAQLSINGTEVPAMGLLQHNPAHAIEPPTTSGRPLSGSDQIELGAVTMRQLGLRLGDKLVLGHDPNPLTVVGTVTLPSFGVVLTDHVSLGHGAMLGWTTMMTVLGLKTDPTQAENNELAASPAFPATILVDVSSAAAATELTNKIAAISAQTGSPGGTYRLVPQQELGAAVKNAGQMGSQPIAFAAGVAAAALLALGLTILASVRQRRRELALLKSLGLRSRQIRAIVAWQTSTILVIAVAAGVPFGIAAGQWAWTSFANSIGVVPTPVVPGPSLLIGVALLLLAGNLLASVPAWLAARIAPAATFRTE